MKPRARSIYYLLHSLGLEVINFGGGRVPTSLVDDDMFKIDEVGTDE